MINTHKHIGKNNLLVPKDKGTFLENILNDLVFLPMEGSFYLVIQGVWYCIYISLTFPSDMMSSKLFYLSLPSKAYSDG